MLPIATKSLPFTTSCRLLPFLAVALAACSSSSPATVPPDGGAHDSGGGTDTGTASKDSAPGTESGTTVERGPKSLAITDADPNGLWWNAKTSTLYIADNENDRVMTWTDADGFKVLVDLPGPTGNDLGGIIQLTDGTLVVVEFGFGTSGLVALVHPDNSTATVPGLDPTKRRLGIALAPDGTIYDSYFNKVSGGTTGFVATLDITSGTETDVITTGLQKPVGVAVAGTTLFVSDQSESEIFAAPLSSPSSYKALATNLMPDLLSVGPSGTIFSGSPTGAVYQVNTTTGTFNTLVTASGTLEPRGTAYDAVNKRLFVAEHDSADVANYIQIVPVGG